MSFEQFTSLLGESRYVNQSSPSGSLEARFVSSLLVYNKTKRAVSPSDFIELSKENRANPPSDSVKIDVLQIQNVRKPRQDWSAKDRRAYQRLLAGHKIATFYKNRLRFMTLTTSKEGRSHDLKEDANTLIKRIRRRYGRFEYLRVRTDEGNGVLHVVFRGSFISRKWLKDQWEDIHSSWNVDVRDCQRYHMGYVVNQYLCNQSGYTRYSMSGLWLPRGSIAMWKAFCRWYPLKRTELFDAYLKNHCLGVMQRKLPGLGDELKNVPFVDSKKKSLNPSDAYVDIEHSEHRCLKCGLVGETRYVNIAGGYLCYVCFPDDSKPVGVGS